MNMTSPPTAGGAVALGRVGDVLLGPLRDAAAGWPPQAVEPLKSRLVYSII
jgi:hypothetical protein